jgi:hypothetical protein
MARTIANRGDFHYRRAPQPDKEYTDYLVCDPKGRKIGRVKEFYRNRLGEPKYIMVRVGLFGLRSVLIPVGFVALDEERRVLTLQ